MDFYNFLVTRLPEIVNGRIPVTLGSDVTIENLNIVDAATETTLLDILDKIPELDNGRISVAINNIPEVEVINLNSIETELDNIKNRIESIESILTLNSINVNFDQEVDVNITNVPTVNLGSISNIARESTLNLILDEVLGLNASILTGVSDISIGESQTLNPGNGWVPLQSGECNEIEIYNNTGTNLRIRYGSTGNYIIFYNDTEKKLKCIENSNEWQIQRNDESNVQVTVNFIRYKY